MSQLSSITETALRLEAQGVDFTQLQVKNSLRNHYPVKDAKLANLELHLNTFNLLGVGSVLPDHFTETVRQAYIDRDTGLGDFINMLNARLVQLLVAVEKRNQVYLHQDLHRITKAQIGALNSGSQLSNDLYFTGFNQHNATTKNGIENSISQYFDVPCYVKPLTGKLTKLSAHSLSKIGTKNQHNQLGQTLSLGKSVVNPQSQATVVLQHRTLSDYRTFLPNTNKAKSLAHALQQQASSDLTFHLTHEVPRKSIRPAKLGHKKTGYLGWNTWLGAQNQQNYHNQIHLGDINHG